MLGYVFDIVLGIFVQQWIALQDKEAVMIFFQAGHEAISYTWQTGNRQLMRKNYGTRHNCLVVRKWEDLYMDITLGEEEIFRLLPMMNMEKAREKAWDKKTSVFASGFAGLLSRPKAEEVQISYSECRYEPFWHIISQVYYEYERKRNYIIPVLASEVRRVTINGTDYQVNDKPHQFVVEGVEHCIEEESTEFIFDAMHNQQRDWKNYLLFDKEAIIDLARIAPEGSIVVQPEMHASAAVRQVLSSMLRPIQADEIHAEKVEVKKVGLYFRPVYAFEYKWDAKGKTAVAEFDGLTGTMTTGGVTLRQQVEKVITRDLIFDIGEITAGMLIPGANIAVRMAKAVADSKENGKFLNH